RVVVTIAHAVGCGRRRGSYPLQTMTTAATHVSSVPAATDDLRTLLVRMQEAQRRAGAPSHDARLASLEKLEKALVARKNAIADAISRDFGNRSRHESLMAELFLVLGAIKHASAHLRDWMEPEDRETSWVFLPARVQVLPQPVGVVGIISPWNYPVQLA